MSFTEFISKFLAFRVVPTTSVVVLFYALVFTSVLWTDSPAPVPRNQRGLNLSQASADLQAITRHPHPYNSHANDLVRTYLLERVNTLTRHHKHILVDDDLRSNGSWAEESLVNGMRAVYYEGNNILVKIEGTDTDADSDAVLFSAHFDSVSTAPGATDDGMGVVSLLQMIEYLVANRPKRTAVFNINNGEEDWLNGAHAFLQHPWSQLTKSFVNLEGAAAGGRPLLFRATSAAPVRSYGKGRVPHPHANVISGDAFRRGVIKSGTDFSVYQTAGLEGVDIAFYKGRAKYHTKYDSIPHTEGEERSLWAMMEAAKGSGIGLLNDDSTHKNHNSAVYFDLFSRGFVMFSIKSLVIFSILLAIFGPVLLLLFRIAQFARERKQRSQENGGVPDRDDTFLARVRLWWVQKRWLNDIWWLSRFPIAIAITFLAQILLAVGYINLNPNVAYSQPYLVMLSSISLAYLTIVFTLNIPLTLARFGSIPAESSKHLTLLQSYGLTWILLIGSFIALGQAGINGIYLFPIWNALLLISCILGSIEIMFGAEGTFFRYEHIPADVRPDDASHIHFTRESEATAVVTGDQEEATENTPLIPRVPIRSNIPSTSSDRGGAIGWWLLQFLVVVPIPLVLVSHMAVLLVSSMSQTLCDGSDPVVVYACLFLVSFLLVLPLAPFSFRFHSSLSYFVLVAFIASTVYTWLVYPFNEVTPFKVMFKQTITVNSTAIFPLDPPSEFTTLTGLKDYVRYGIIPKLPSAVGKEITCTPSRKLGLHDCSWESGLIPTPGGIAFPRNGYFSFMAKRSGARTAHFRVAGRNTKNCRLYFDNKRITRFYVHGSDGIVQPDYPIPKDGLDQIRFWTRDWDKELLVDVEWKSEDGSDDVKPDEGEDPFQGRVACEWAQYESGMIDMEGNWLRGSIPVYEEVLRWLPKWALSTKFDDGLVEVVQKFDI